MIFQCYCLISGKDLIQRWYEKQPGEVRAAFDVAVESLRNLPRKWWRRKVFAELGKRNQRVCDGLGEIRLEANDVHYRIFGFFDDTGAAFILLGAFEKDCDPTYAVACPIAQKRKMRLKNGPNRSRKCFDG
jgi:hypothetical protein